MTGLEKIKTAVRYKKQIIFRIELLRRLGTVGEDLLIDVHNYLDKNFTARADADFEAWSKEALENGHA
jgi:hypothetical protein